MNPQASPRLRPLLRLGALLGLLPLTACQYLNRESAPIGGGAGPMITRPVPISAGNTIVQVGDTLDVVVLEDATFNSKATVRESGDIILPKLGRVHVAGATLHGAEDAVRQRIRTDQIKDATVIVERSQRVSSTNFAERPKVLVFLTGAVARPGQHLVAVNDRDGLTCYEALLIAGGATPYGDTRRAYILRKIGGGQRERIPVDLRALSQGQGIDPLLREGDVVFVPERRFGL